MGEQFGLRTIVPSLMVTHPKNLRTGRSIWDGRRGRYVPNGPLTTDVRTDVLVIGAGITGAMIAEALSTAGREVVLVDKRGPAKGSTAASTALVQYAVDTPLTRLAPKIGKQSAVRAWRRSRLAVDALAARLKELKVADVVPRATLFLEGNRLDRKGLQREEAARRAAGLASLFLDRVDVQSRFGISGRAGLLDYGDYVLNPRTTTVAFLRSAAKKKARIFAPVEIVDLEIRRTGVTAAARYGPRITACSVVFATGYEVPKGLPRTGHRVISTWAIGTVPQQARLWRQQCMIWEASEPYLYLRTTSDGRVICGGEDEDFSDENARDGLLPAKARVLSRKLKRLLPQLDARFQFCWTGSFGQTRTGLPKIGPIPGKPHCWVALGYGGNGITYAQIASDIIVGAVTGHPDADADLYGFR
jgi:glycine/D-amino acid oxidase-like deaminating enzyme